MPNQIRLTAQKILSVVPDFEKADLVLRKAWPKIIKEYISRGEHPPTNIIHTLLQEIGALNEDHEIVVCNRCVRIGYSDTICPGCGGNFHDVAQRSVKEQLKAWNYKIVKYFPPQKLRGEPRPFTYLGVELELKSTRGEYSNFPTQIEVKHLKNFAIVKHDGSLGEKSFELNSVPATLLYHKSGVWDAFFEAAPAYVEAPEGHGMHVHVTRKVLSPLTIGKFLIFMNSESNEAFINTIAGRGDTSYTHAKKDHKIKDPLINNTCNSEGRYARVNTTNKDTLEVRMFQSTANKRRFLSNLEFVHAAVSFSSKNGIRHMEEKHFLKWINNSKRRELYANLHDFLVAHKYLDSDHKVAKTIFIG